MKSRAILATNYNDISNEIKTQLTHKYDAVYYIHSLRDVWVNMIRLEYPQFIFVDYNDVFSKIGKIKLTGNYLFVISHLHITKIPDSKLGVLRRSDVDKLVIDNHPFISKSEVWYLYFLYMTFDKTLLGYPHSYAFRDAPLETNPFDVVTIAHKVSSATHCYMQQVFDISKIRYTQIQLSAQEHFEYLQLKERLFETETTPKAIITKLKRYVNQTNSMRKEKAKCYNPLYPNRIHELYLNGIYDYVYSDSKVDLYLLERFNEYLHNANTFINTLWSIQNGA